MNVKVALILAAALALLGLGFYLGTLRGTAKADAAQAALEGFERDQSANTAKAVLAERAAGATELARVNEKLKEFENAPVDPIVPDIVERVRLAACPAIGAVPGASAPTSGTLPPGRVPAGDQGSQRLLELAQAAADAAARDAQRLNLCRDVWPR